jgi:hypothetical protein
MVSCLPAPYDRLSLAGHSEHKSVIRKAPITKGSVTVRPMDEAALVVRVKMFNTRKAVSANH